MGITCKSMGKVRSVFRKIRNEEEKEKKEARKILKKKEKPTTNE